jgi:hypothetical protein
MSIAVSTASSSSQSVALLQEVIERQLFALLAELLGRLFHESER